MASSSWPTCFPPATLRHGSLHEWHCDGQHFRCLCPHSGHWDGSALACTCSAVCSNTAGRWLEARSSSHLDTVHKELGLNLSSRNSKLRLKWFRLAFVANFLGILLKKTFKMSRLLPLSDRPGLGAASWILAFDFTLGQCQKICTRAYSWCCLFSLSLSLSLSLYTFVFTTTKKHIYIYIYTEELIVTVRY
jgi:hypothetical protein